MKEIKTNNVVYWIFGIFCVFVFWFAICDSSKDVEPKKPLTVDEKIQEQFSKWDGSHRALVRVIKKHMNDPDSFEHIETKYKKNKKSITVWMKYRGKNAYGGKVIDYTQAELDFDGNLLKIK
jgi:hypothetical protein